MMRLAARLWCVACLLVLTACATPPGPVGADGAFARSGRFAVSLQPVGAAPQAAQGGFTWRDDGGRLVLDLYSPLGSTLAQVQVVPGHATLRQADGARQDAPDPDALLARVWGHPMPVTGLRRWIRGQLMSASTAHAVQRDTQGRPSAFEQDGWRVRLDQYDAQGPRRVRLLREDDQGHWRLQLVMDAARDAH